MAVSACTGEDGNLDVLDAFELDVLGAVSNDYEAVHTIRSDLERQLGRPVSSGEIESSLVRLAQAGFIDAFVPDPVLGTYRKVPVDSGLVGELWFRINSVGRTEYERLVA